MHYPELLAPAGSPESFWAAFQAGADAFYLGADSFNARRRARNFSPDELRLVTETAHAHGKKIYLTLNTLVFDREIPALIDLLDLAESVTVDAVIVQDWGVASIVRRWYPKLPLHASTQLFSHTSDHIAFLKDQGFSRVILPRELTLDEIAALIDRVPFSYEVFVHGAMCCAFSGCCLFSSYRYGESGNRGSCRQLCRHAFSHDDRTDYPFSLKDMNTLPIIRDLVKAGIDSLKIEGRLKPAAVVGETVAAYRKALDSIQTETIQETITLGTLRREEHTGYFVDGPSYTKLVNPSSGTVGEALGVVTGTDTPVVTARLTGPVQKGDRIRIQDARGRNWIEATLLDYSLREAENNVWTLRWTLPRSRPPSGMLEPLTLYRIGVSSPRDVIHLMEKARGPIFRDVIRLALRLEPGLLTVTAFLKDSPDDFVSDYSCPTQPPRTAPLAPERFVELFRETHTHPFRVDSVDVVIDGDVFVPLSILKELRRTAFRDIADHIGHVNRTRSDTRCTEILEALAALTSLPAETIPERRFVVYDEKQATQSDVPLLAPLKLEQPPVLPPESGVVLAPPLFVPQAKRDRWTNWITSMVSQGYRCFIAPTYGWLPVLAAAGADDIIAGPFFYLVNSFALDWGIKNGISSFILSGDIPEADIGPILSSPYRIMLSGGPKEQFATRLPLPPGPYQLGGHAYRAVDLDDYTVLVDITVGT